MKKQVKRKSSRGNSPKRALVKGCPVPRGDETEPLSGIRILDLTSVVMGPYATQILGDLGADVIKLEPPSGDTTRKITPNRNPDMGYMFLNLNRNKRSLVLDLKRREGLSAFFKLAKTVDVIVYNVRPKAMERLGVRYDDLALVNPRLICLSLVGFAQHGPYADHPVYEDLIQSLTAVPSLLVKAGSARPQYVPFAFNDRSVGLHAAIAILTAIVWRERSGRGQFIELPMFETMAQGVLSEHLGGLTYEPAAGPPGYKRTLTAHRRPYETTDGYVSVIVYTDKHWQSFLALIGEEERFSTDPRFRDIGIRTKFADELYQLVADVMRKGSTAGWLEKLNAADIPAEPLHTLESLVCDRHLEATQFINFADHPSEGKIRQTSPIGRWSASPPSIRRHAPRLGEHSVEVLMEAGFDKQAVQDLVEKRVVVQAS